VSSGLSPAIAYGSPSPVAARATTTDDDDEDDDDDAYPFQRIHQSTCGMHRQNDAPMKMLMICEPIALATAPGPRPFFAMAIEARQSGTCDSPWTLSLTATTTHGRDNARNTAGGEGRCWHAAATAVLILLGDAIGVCHTCAPHARMVTPCKSSGIPRASPQYLPQRSSQPH
jgi:hypothetical protein